MQTTQETLKKIPTIATWQLIPAQLRLINNPLQALQENDQQFDGLYNMYLGIDKVTLTTNPSIAKYVLQKNNRNYVKSKFVESVKEVIGNGLLTSEGAYWLKQRRLIQPSFHKKRLEELSEIMLQHTNIYRDRIADLAETGERVNIASEMMNLTLKVVASALFSSSVTDEDLKRVEYIMGELQSYLVQRIRMPYLEWWRKLTGKVAHYQRLVDELDQQIIDIIEARRKVTDPPSDLLTMLLHSTYDTGEKMDNQQLRDESLVMFTAGHETSANALSWALYLLAKHPDKQQKLLAELQTVLGERDVTFADLPQLTYTKQVIQETMRLYPPVWIIDRAAITDDVIDEHHLPKDQIINIFTYGMHRNEKYWPQPEAFQPERFAKENSDNIVPYSYIPFGGGPRMCIGYHFAYYEMQIILAQFLRSYEFCLANENETVVMEPLVTLRPKNGIQMWVRKR